MTNPKQLWVFFRYAPVPRDGAEPMYIKPHLCHPSVARLRIADLRERYGVEPERVQVLSNNGIDLGGMAFTDDLVLTFHVGVHRTISVPAHQADDIQRLIHLAKKCEVAGRRYRRFGRWPGVIVYISEADARKLLRALARFVAAGSCEDPVERRARLDAVLAKANRITLAEQREANEYARQLVEGSVPAAKA